MARSGFKALLLGFVLPAAAASDEHCHVLNQVDIEASRILSQDDQQALVAPYLGSCTDADLARSLLSTISDYFIEQGYVTTRPYLVEQDITDGQLEIRILEGRIEAVVDEASGGSNARIRSAFLSAGEILNLRDLETALEVIQRPRSVSASFEIQPGSRQGTSIVAVTTEEDNPLHIEFGINAQTDLDSQLSFRAVMDNPFNINDIIEFRYNSGDVRETLQSNRSRELAYSFPLGSFLVALSRSDIEYEQRIQGINDSFVSRGDAVTDTLRVSKILSRSQTNRLRAAIALELKDSRSFFEDQLIEVSSYETSQLRLELGHDWLQSWGQIGTVYVYHQGLDSFGARDDDFFTPDTGFDSEARLQFEKVNIDSRLVYFLPDPSWQWALNLHLQYSDDILFDNDKINLGSPYTVRGYSSALSGSNAWYVRSDLIKQFRRQPADRDNNSLSKSIAFSLGIDYGEVKCESDNPDTCGDIYGIGAGIEIFDANFAGRLLWGYPLKKIGDDIGDENQFLIDLRWLF